ncbi:hypothetical protein O9992_21815 [Vibrio lentus]|nr:hypothetical protein [Vibrio lentus]
MTTVLRVSAGGTENRLSMAEFDLANRDRANCSAAINSCARHIFDGTGQVK